MDIRSDALRRAHSFTGLVPLGLYLGFHAWEHWPVRLGRDEALARLEHTSAAPFEIALVLLPLCAHAVLGLKLSRAADESAAYPSHAFRSFQAITGVLALAFIGFHVALVWWPRVLDGGRVATGFGAMLDSAGTAWGAAAYVVGSSAVCVHFGQGLSAAWIRHRPDAPARLARVIGVLCGVLLWLAFIDELASYAAGAPLL